MHNFVSGIICNPETNCYV